MNRLLWYPPAETKIPLKAILQCLRSSTNDAELIIRQATDSPNCILGPSARALLFMLLKILFEVKGRTKNEILLPGYTCYSVAAAVVKAGLKIRFYDIDPTNLNPLLYSIEENCTEKTLAVVSQHLFGIPSDIQIVANIAENRGAYHIEDAAQAFGARYQGKTLGAKGDFGLFSFGRGKPLPLGAGGALIASEHNLNQIKHFIKYATGWHELAIAMLTQIIATPYVYGVAEKLPLGLGKTTFEPNFKIGRTMCLINQLVSPMNEKFSEMNSHRQTIATIYKNRLPFECQVRISEGCTPVYPRFPLLAKDGPVPPELIRLGVRRLYPQALNQEPQIKAHSENPEQRLDGAETLAKILVTLPTHHSISENVAAMVVEKIKNWLTIS